MIRETWRGEQSLGNEEENITCIAADLGLIQEIYTTALRYLFDRPLPEGEQNEWYWEIEDLFSATPLEWTQIQTLLFTNAHADLTSFDNEQVGMGLNYLMDPSISDVPFAVLDVQVPLEDAIRMMMAMPVLWRECIGPRLGALHAPIGSVSGGRLGYVCHMWFDVWPTFRKVSHLRPWQDALWHVFDEMLSVPCREVQVAALHGIGHNVRHLARREMIDERISAFIRSLGKRDEELRNYAEHARNSMVQ